LHIRRLTGQRSQKKNRKPFNFTDYEFYHGPAGEFFELLICRRERREIIGKLEPGSLIDYLKLVPMGLRTGATIRTASETAPGIPAGALKVGCLLLGLGAGLLFGFMLTRITEIQSYDTRRVVYGGSVLVFGGLGLIVSFIVERVLSRRR